MHYKFKLIQLFTPKGISDVHRKKIGPYFTYSQWLEWYQGCGGEAFTLNKMFLSSLPCTWQATHQET